MLKYGDYSERHCSSESTNEHRDRQMELRLEWVYGSIGEERSISHNTSFALRPGLFYVVKLPSPISIDYANSYVYAILNTTGIESGT